MRSTGFDQYLQPLTSTTPSAVEEILRLQELASAPLDANGVRLVVSILAQIDDQQQTQAMMLIGDRLEQICTQYGTGLGSLEEHFQLALLLETSDLSAFAKLPIYRRIQEKIGRDLHWFKDMPTSEWMQACGT
jgi:hypothetical protein